MRKKAWLQIAAIGCFIIAIIHVGIAIVGGEWYVFFGAGEEMARLDQSGSWYPKVITVLISLVVMIMGLYALSAEGSIRKLPYLRTVIAAISTTFLLRGVAGFILPFTGNHPFILQNSISFWMVTSTISLFIGILFLIGLIKRWKWMSA